MPESRFSSCSDNHGLVANPPTRNANCFRVIRTRVQGATSIRTELVARRPLKLSLMASTVDRIEGSKNPETWVLCARKFGFKFADKVGMNLPSQCQPPRLDSILGIVIPWGAKFDVLNRLVLRKDLLYPFVELLGKCFQVFGSVESGTPQFPWPRIESSVCERNVRMHLGRRPLTLP
jgi:hypothetical protein